MLNSQSSNLIHQDFNMNNSKSVYLLEQNDFSEPIELNPMSTQKTIGNSNAVTLFKAFQFDQYQNNITIDEILQKQKSKFKEEERGNYQINIDGVHKRRALFGLDMSTKNKSFEASDLSNNVGESPPRVIEARQDNTKSSTDFLDRSPVNMRQLIDLSRDNTQSPMQSLKVLSPRMGNRKISGSLHQAEQFYVASQQDYKIQGFSDRLKQVSLMIQSGCNDTHSEENSTNTKIQSHQLQNLSFINERVKLKQNLTINVSKRLSKRRLSNHPSPSTYAKSAEDIPKAKNYFVILSLVKKFVKSCLLKKDYKDFNLLESKHFKMIGDSSYFIQKNEHYQQLKIKQQLKKDNQKENRLDALVKKKSHVPKFTMPLNYSFINILILKMKKMFIDCKLFSKIFNKKIILPNSLYIIMWDLVIILIMLFHLVVIPVKTCFYLDMNEDIYQSLLYIIPIIFFTIDIIIAFNTGIYEFGVIVVEQKLISRAYWKNKFLYHVSIISTLLLNFKFQNIIIEFFAIYLKLNQVYLYLQSIILFYFLSHFEKYVNNKFLVILYLYQLQYQKHQQIRQRMNKIDQHFQITFKLPKFSELFKLVALVLFVAHLCGCGFHYVGSESISVLQQDMSWIISQKIQSENWMHKYIYSIYFAIVTMVTIGYGDVYPTNIYERVYVIFMTLFSCGIFAYSINTIGNIFLEQNYKQKAFQQKLFDIQKYLQSKSINKEAQIRVFKYLEYLNEQTDEVLTKGQVILSECSQDLREEILKDYYGKILQNLKILQNNFSVEFIQALSIKMKEKRFGPGEVIIQQGNKSKNLYFLSNGDIEYYIQNDQKKKQILTLQNIVRVFDFRMFITETASPYSIRTRLNTTMAFLTFEDFLSALQEFKLDYEKYCMIKDQFQYSDRFDNQCLSCGQYGHDIQDCSQIHFNVNKQIFLQKIARSPFQPRGKLKSILIKQIQRNKIKCLKNLKSIKTDLKMLRWKYAQNAFDEYNDLCVHELTQINENDRDFFMRCPKIKIQFQKKDPNQMNFKEGCEIKIFDEFEREKDYTSSSGSDSMYDSDYQSEDQQQALQPSDSQRLISLIKTEILNLQSITEKEQNIEAIQPHKRRQSNMEKEIMKVTSRQSFSKTPEEFQQQMNSFNSFRDNKKQNQDSVKSLDNEESEKNYNNLFQSDYKGNVQKKKQTVVVNHQEEKHDGEVLYQLKKQLDDVLVRLDTLQKREEENIMASLHRNLKGSQKQIQFDPYPAFNDPKDMSHQHINFNLDQSKNQKVKFQRREGMRKTHLKKRNEDRNLSIAITKQPQPKEGYYYESNDTEQNHIFGVLKFEFDKMKEFSLYYPKYNYSNIIKSYKKIQGKPAEKNKPRKTLFFQNAVHTLDVQSQKHSNTPKIHLK